MCKIEKLKKHKVRIVIVLGILCFVVLGVASWYFAYVRPLRNANSGPVYRVTPPEKNETAETAESLQPSAKDTGDVNHSQEVSVGTKDTVSLSNSKKRAPDVGTGTSATSIEEAEQMNPEQDAQKRAAAEARAKELAELYAQAERIQKLSAAVHSRHSRYKEIMDRLPTFLSDDKLSETDAKTLLNQTVPMLVEQLNSFSAEQQQEVLKQLRPMMHSMIDDPGQADQAADEFLKTLHKHGFEPKF
jgi:hypothetical protein